MLITQLTDGVTTQSLLAFTLGVFVLAITPGPGILAATSCALSSGFRSALSVISGIVFGDILYLLIAIFGVTLVTQFIDNGLIIVKIFGSLYLVWLGWKLWTENRINLDNNDETSKKNALKNFTAGFGITISNPKTIIFYGAFVPVFVEPTNLNINNILLLATIIAIVVSVVIGFYAYLASRAKQLFKSEIAMRNINRIAGTVMFGAAVLVVLV